MALDEQLKRVVTSLIGVERERRVLTANDAFRAIRDNYTRRGALGHGRFPVDLDGAAALEYEARARLWMQEAEGVLRNTATQWTEEAGQELLLLLQLELQTDLEFLAETMQRYSAGSRSRTDALEAAKGRCRVELEQRVAIAVLREDRTRLPLLQHLSSPRYAAPLAAWKRSRDLLDASPPDHGNAAKEAVAAVEALARLVVGRPSASLGDAIKILRSSSRVPGAAFKGLEELWGISSSTDGVRHGAAATLVDPSLARYMIDLSQAALRLLLAHDEA